LNNETANELEENSLSKKFKSEKQMQKLMERAIVRDELYDLIEDTAKLEQLVQRDSDVQFPQFAIDHLSRTKAIEAGANVLQSLTFLTLLTGDKNVSITSGEVMRPDLVCINPEEQSVVIFELKKAHQTGRQALTELLAYEHEVKNLLPLLSNFDFNFVLISPEWSTLMDHAVSAAIAWSNRKILCLKPSLTKKKLRLETYLPTAWKITGAVHFPDEALPCVTVCLYEKNAYEPKEQTSDEHVDDDDFPDSRLVTALEIIAREGDRVGGHGFAILWKDHLSHSLCKYNLTVCGIAPFSLFKASRRRGNIGSGDGKLVKEIDKYIYEYDPAGHSDSLTKIAMSADGILKEISNPALEGFSQWNAEKHTLSERAEPILCEFWGSLGEYARSYITNPAVRAHRRNTLLNGLGNWRDPAVGLPILQSFTKPDLFIDGNVRCSDAFRFGKLFGLDRTLRLNIRNNDNPQLRCKFVWNRIELMTAIDEVRMLADAAENVAAPEKPLKFYGDPMVEDDKESYDFIDWMHLEFLQNSPIHNLFFDLGLEGCLAFDRRQNAFSTVTISEEWLAQIKDKLPLAGQLVLSRYRQLYGEGGLWGDLTHQYEVLLRIFKLRKNFSVTKPINLDFSMLFDCWEAVLRASDHILEPVFHKHAPVASATIDWDWLKQGVDEMRKRGVKNAGIMLLPSGQITSGELTPMGLMFSMQIDNPELEVPFMDQSNGLGVMRIVTWQKLKDGEVF